jgi:hemoglobin-like flavoprotein
LIPPIDSRLAAIERISESCVQIDVHSEQMQKIDQSIEKSIKEVQSVIELQKDQFNKAIDDSTKTLAELIATQQNVIPAINTRLTALEGINTLCDLPNALTSLTE